MVLSSCIVRQRFCLLSCIFFYSACYCIFFYSQQNPVQFLMEFKKNCHQLNEETTMKITSGWLLRCKQWCSWKKRTERREGREQWQWWYWQHVPRTTWCPRQEELRIPTAAVLVHVLTTLQQTCSSCCPPGVCLYLSSPLSIHLVKYCPSHRYHSFTQYRKWPPLRVRLENGFLGLTFSRILSFLPHSSSPPPMNLPY